MLSAMSAKTVSPRPPLPPIVLSSNRRRPSSSSSSSQPHAQQKTNSKGGSSSSSSSLSLRGSDVLHALQRAATQLPKKKTIKTKKKRPQSPKNQEGEFHDDDVRPINIRSDWEERIAELEARVQELQQAQYHN